MHERLKEGTCSNSFHNVTNQFPWFSAVFLNKNELCENEIFQKPNL